MASRCKSVAVRAWSALLLGFVAMAGAAQPVARPPGLPGTQAHRLPEPVFNGHAYVYEAGKDNARTVVLVHGLGDSGARDFADHVSWLARSYHVLAVDLPGFGQSDKGNLLYSPPNYAAFLKHVVDRFARKPFALVGHSMGGVVSLRYAAMYPADVERLTVIDTPGLLHRYAFSSYQLAKAESGFLAPAVDPLPTLAGFARKILGKVERTTFDPEAVLNSPTLRATVLGGDPSRIAGLALALDDVSAHIDRVTMPTLVIWGQQDTVAPRRTGKMLARILPQAQLALIEGAAHVPMEETPQRFRALLEAFLRDGLPAPVPAAVMPRHGSVRCTGRSHVVFEGEYESLRLNDCKDVRIRHARIGELHASDSTLIVEDSHLGGGEVALYASSSTVEMASVRIEGEVGIFAQSSRFDIAGGDIAVTRAVMQASSPSTVAFSLTRVKSPALDGLVHDFFSVTEKTPVR